MPIMRAIVNDGKNLVVVAHMPLCGSLEEGLALILTNLQLSLPARVQQVVDSLIVNLNVLALDFKLDFFNSLISEHCLVIECLFTS